MSFRMPAEHGAWGMLLVPFFSAAAAAGVPTVQGSLAPVALAGVCLLGLFLLRGSVEAGLSRARLGGSREWGLRA